MTELESTSDLCFLQTLKVRIVSHLISHNLPTKRNIAMSNKLEFFIKSLIKSLSEHFKALINIPASCRKNCWSHFSSCRESKKCYSIFQPAVESTNRFLCDDMWERFVSSVQNISLHRLVVLKLQIKTKTPSQRSNAYLKLGAKKHFIRSINKRIKLINQTP